MAKGTTAIALAPELKAEAESILNELGLTLPAAVRLCLTQIVLQRGLPFEVKLPKQVTLQPSQYKKLL